MNARVISAFFWFWTRKSAGEGIIWIAGKYQGAKNKSSDMGYLVIHRIRLCLNGLMRTRHINSFVGRMKFVAWGVSCLMGGNSALKSSCREIYPLSDNRSYSGIPWTSLLSVIQFEKSSKIAVGCCFYLYGLDSTDRSREMFLEKRSSKLRLEGRRNKASRFSESELHSEDYNLNFFEIGVSRIVWVALYDHVEWIARGVKLFLRAKIL